MWRQGRRLIGIGEIIAAGGVVCGSCWAHWLSGWALALSGSPWMWVRGTGRGEGVAGYCGLVNSGLPLDGSIIRGGGEVVPNCF